jgi:Ran GTPase-activating protein (RanGAP) involved in mRNA processing and transport
VDNISTTLTLKKLSLNECQIGEAELVELAKIHNLEELHLESNKFRHQNLGAIFEISSLKKLNLACNAIDNLGAQAISESLAKNTSLERLGIAYNKIGDEGALKIAEALSINSSLLRLSLANNEIGDSGAISITSALSKNTSLRELSLWGNKFDSEAIKIPSSINHLEIILQKKSGEEISTPDPEFHSRKQSSKLLQSTQRQ